jgi:hypothetical protein
VFAEIPTDVVERDVDDEQVERGQERGTAQHQLDGAQPAAALN